MSLTQFSAGGKKFTYAEKIGVPAFPGLKAEVVGLIPATDTAPAYFSVDVTIPQGYSPLLMPGRENFWLLPEEIE